jgi:hypothetical protein
MKACALIPPKPIPRGGHPIPLLFPKILYIIAGGFVEAQAVQLAIGGECANGLLQDVPDLQDEVFAAGHFSLHEIYIFVEVFMVQLIDYFLANQGAELFKIYHEACFGIGLSFHRYNQLEIMPMPVYIGARAEHLCVLLRGPVGVIQLVSCIKMFFPANVYHASAPIKIKLQRYGLFSFCKSAPFSKRGNPGQGL